MLGVSPNTMDILLCACHGPESEVKEEGTVEALCRPGCCDVTARTRAVCDELVCMCFVHNLRTAVAVLHQKSFESA